MSTLLVDTSLLELKASKLSDSALLQAMRNSVVERQVAEVHKNESSIEYWQAWLEALAGEVGSRGIAHKVSRSNNNYGTQNAYKLNAQLLKSKVDIAEYIGQYVVLHRCGANKLVGLCPLHGERHASLFVYTERQDWYCFGCLRGGDILSFIQLFCGMSFYGALEVLAQYVSREVSS